MKDGDRFHEGNCLLAGLCIVAVLVACMVVFP